MSKILTPNTLAPDFTLPVHPHAGIAALTAEFAAIHNKFWEMHDLLYENQANLEIPDLMRYAESLALSAVDLESALKNETYADTIQSDFIGGVRSGVNGTPSFFINGHRHDGSYEYEGLLIALNNVAKQSV